MTGRPDLAFVKLNGCLVVVQYAAGEILVIALCDYLYAYFFIVRINIGEAVENTLETHDSCNHSHAVRKALLDAREVLQPYSIRGHLGAEISGAILGA